MFNSKPVSAITVATILVGMLAGCATDTAQAVSTSTATSSPVPAHTSNGVRWGTPATTKLADSLVAGAPYIDPDGDATSGDHSPQDAGDPKYPASIAKNGAIYLEITLWAGDVDRAMTSSYVSPDKTGKEVGPSIDCTKTSVDDKQTFACSALFKDRVSVTV